MSRVLREAELVAFDGHSDYGGSLGGFVENWGDAVTSRSALLILGDARTDYRDPNLPALRRLVGQARRAHCLNPEPRRQWAVATPWPCGTPMCCRCTSAARPVSSPMWSRPCSRPEARRSRAETSALNRASKFRPACIS